MAAMMVRMMSAKMMRLRRISAAEYLFAGVLFRAGFAGRLVAGRRRRDAPEDARFARDAETLLSSKPF